MSRVLRVAVLFALGLAAAGCGGSSVSSLTGGSVPIGPTRVAGETTLATDPSQPVAGAEVVVVDSQGGEQHAVTDASGQFSLHSVAPGPATISVAAPGCRPLQMRVNVPEAGAAQVALALTPTDVEPGDVQSVTLDREGIEAHVGDVVRIRAQQMHGPGPGPMPAIAPSWVVEGGVGTVRLGGPGDALFVATAAGTGRIVVTAGGRETSIPVTVLP